MRLYPLAAILGAATVAACAPAPSTTVVVDPAAPPAVCRAGEYQHFVGQKSPAISIPAGTEYQHFRTGDAVSQDVNATRLNFEYDRSGKLKRVFCG